MKIAHIILCPLLLLAPFPAHADLSEAELVRTLRERSRPYFAKFKGVRATRSITSKELDPASGKLRTLKQFKVDFWSHFYLKPAQHILSCKVNGEKRDPDDCKPKGNPKAVIPLFDKESAKNYRFKLLGIKTIMGIACYRLKIVPLKKTDQHMSGFMYFAVDTLKAVLMEGTMAKLSFPLKRFFIKLRFGYQDGFPIVLRGYMDLEARVPLFFHARLVSRFTETNHRFVPR